KGNYVHAAWGILIANIFDGLDGWVARLTNSTTRFGIELDSLSDLVAFGVAPAVLIYSWALSPFGRFGYGAAFLFVSCGALRLARYNVQMGSTESKAFTGLPIPGAGTVIATTVLFYYEVWGNLAGRNYLFLFLPFLLAVLMVSTLKFHGLKEIDFKKRKPFWLLVAVVAAFVLIIMHPEIVLFVFAIIYVMWGIIEGTYLIHRKRQYKEII
ncbi:MAG: CDP-diacylglycerol--serine O-phosphatidyltransferase, partial [Nitrospirota bacterium]|nr:CDP-diacylglycerol--serine O-phosphatidyltransferase [Nitrospirota bacterium]